MNYWLLLADPQAYSFDDLEREKQTTWDGIAGSLAQKHLRNFKKGDMALVYHTAPGKVVVGTAKVKSDPYLDPKDKAGNLVVVDIQYVERLRKSVSLQSLRENGKLSGMSFLKIQRIAVSPVSKSEYDEILKMGQSD